MLEIVQNTYKTYYNTAEKRPERQRLRVLLTALLAVCFCLFSGRPPLDLNNMMITGLTILTGFTFTALFSDHSLAEAGLPKPSTEDDVQDLRRLALLATNFHIRSRYFIILSIFDVCLLIARSVEWSLPQFLHKGLAKLVSWTEYDFSTALAVARHSTTAIDKLTIVFSIFLFLECLYTFYRLTETIISIVNTRRDYLKANRG